MSSGGTTYIKNVTNPSTTIEISGSAFAKYYYPDFGTTTYKLQATDTREQKGFYIRESPGDNTIKGAETDIVLTIKYDNGNDDDS
jgi:hypothetical protein